MTKLIYNYDARTGVLLSSSEADESPLEPGVFLIPAHATEVPPPICPLDHVVVFDGDAWCVEPEVRGLWYKADHQSVFVAELGTDVAGFTRVEPPSNAHDLVGGNWVLNEERAMLTTKVALVAAVQAFMDRTAQERGYDNLLSAVSYADEPAVPTFQAEGQAFRAWRSQVWAKCNEVLADVQLGKAAVPSAEQLIAQLPEVAL